jgi:hypothetical protein
MPNDSTGSATPSGTDTVEAAAALIAKLGSGDAGKPRQREAQAETADDADDVLDDVLGDSEEATEADETAPEDQDSDELPQDDGDADEEATDATDEDTEGSEGEDKLYTVKIDGKDEQVPLKELLAGYSRTADYHRKTEALAEERKSFSGEREQVQQERGLYAQLLPALVQQLQQALPQAPDPALRDADPLEYMLRKEQYEEQMQRIWAAQSEMERVTQAQEQEALTAFQAQVQEAFKKLPDLVPEWKDPKVYEQERPKLRAFLKKAGYSDQEINGASDPRALALARKAWRYEQLTARKPRPDPRPSERVPRPAAVVPPVQRREKEYRATRQRLAQTGHIDDAARAIGLLGD